MILSPFVKVPEKLVPVNSGRIGSSAGSPESNTPCNLKVSATPKEISEWCAEVPHWAPPPIPSLSTRTRCPLFSVFVFSLTTVRVRVATILTFASPFVPKISVEVIVN